MSMLQLLNSLTVSVGGGGGGGGSSGIPPAEIGDTFGGGYYAGLLSTSADGVPTHILVVAPKTTGETLLAYNLNATSDPGAVSVFDGFTNTTNIADADHPAAQFCKNLSIGGYTDWYLPSIEELDILYKNLKPTESNSTSFGTNNYSVTKSSSNYVTARPGLVNNPIFRSGGAEALQDWYYISSTQGSSTNRVSGIRFDNGSRSLTALFKDEQNNVRAIRKVPFTLVETGTAYGPYRYWRINITDVRSPEDGMQMAEFRFQFHGVNITIFGGTVTAPGSTPGGIVENVERLFSGNLDEKFYNVLSTGVTDIRVDLVNARSFTGYQWATANDVPARDPKSWTIQASNDGTNWTIIHTVSNYTATSARNTWQTAWNF